MPTAQLDQPPNQFIRGALRRSRLVFQGSSKPDARDTSRIEFVDSSDEAFARALDEFGIEWRYKPRTFAVEWDDEGNFVDSFTPDFYLPANDLYIELVSADRARAAADARSVRLLRQNNPSVRIDLMDAASFMRDT